MGEPAAGDVLNRLLNLLCRSLPMYLRHAKPFMRRADDKAAEAIKRIAAEQEELAAKVSDALVDAETTPRLAGFPMEFTDLHDLTVSYMIKMAIRYQKYDIQAYQECVEALRMAPVYQPLAEEALGLAKGHLEELEELAGEPAAN